MNNQDHIHALELFNEKAERVLGRSFVAEIRDEEQSSRAIAEWWKFGASVDEILENLPYLSLSRVFDALSYYQDHQDEIERYIKENRIKERRRSKLGAG